MKRYLFSFIISLCYLTVLSQTKMRTIEELINTADPGWTFVKEWIDSAKNKVEILPVDTAKSREALYQTQVTSRSPMGAIIFMTGGILIDNGWIRILGSGNKKLHRSLPEWNKGKSFKEFGDPSAFLLIADDAIGGFYILNNGEFGKDLGKIYYFSPDNLKYEPLDITYSEFLLFCFNNDLNEFYKDFRWTNWKKDIVKLQGDKVFNFVPPLWTTEGKKINNTSKKAISIEEQYLFNLDMREKLGLK